VKVYFPNPKAALPVLQADGSVEWLGGLGAAPGAGWASAGDWLGAVDSISAG